MKYSFSILFLLYTATVLPQKKLHKELSSKGISEIVITADEVFHIQILSEKTDKISIVATIEGEYYENVTIPISEKNEILSITTGYSPYFVKENDKLAAHKLIAIDLAIIVPENFTVSIQSKIASVLVRGNYKTFTVGLETGNCYFQHFLGNANLQTKHGFITVFARPDVTANCKSARGKIINALPKFGKYLIQAESIEGNITLLQTK